MKTLEDYILPTQDELFDMLCEEYKGNCFVRKDSYILVKGKAPIMLIAHMDTVHKERVKYICKSKGGNILMSPQGIGGDDRCGIYALNAVYARAEVKPWLLFTCDEEIGGYGARDFAKDYHMADLPKELDFLIWRSENLADLGIIYTGICGNVSVLHTESAHEGNVLRLAAANRKFRLLHILECENRHFNHLFRNRSNVILAYRLITESLTVKEGTRMSVRAVNENGIGGDSRSLSNRRLMIVTLLIRHHKNVCRNYKCLLFTVIKGESCDVKIVKNALHVSCFIISGNTHSVWRSNTKSCKSCFHLYSP